MGAISIEVKAIGNSMQDAFSNAVEDARYEYGADYYNGTIAHCHIKRDITIEYHSADRKDEFIQEQLRNCNKLEVFGVTLSKPVENSLKIKTRVNNIKGTSVKFIRKYIVTNRYGDITFGNYIDTKTEAVKRARKISEREKIDTKISIVNVPVNYDKSFPVVAEINYIRSKKEKPGEYLFFGWAPC